MDNDSIKSLRWILRIASGMLILLMLIGEFVFEDILSMTEILQLSIAGIGLIGLGLAWKFELGGGIIALLAFVAVGFIEPNTLNSPILLAYPFVALSFIAMHIVSRKANNESIH